MTGPIQRLQSAGVPIRARLRPRMSGIENFPQRIRLSRAKGWRMPEGAVKVDRSTVYGNPFVTGRDGTAAECVRFFSLMMIGYLPVGLPAGLDQQKVAQILEDIWGNMPALRGRPLACWCALDKPCHADVLLVLANNPPRLPRAAGAGGFVL